MKRNPNMGLLTPNYLFPEINLRKSNFLTKYPSADVISLGIGDTTEPIPNHVANDLSKASLALGTFQGYTGYGPDQGLLDLREIIASKIYNGLVKQEEIFISDGAKCDLGRLQTMFGKDISIAVQNPVYPVYVDGSLIQGVKEIVMLPCRPQNHFFPDLGKAPRTDLIYFCSPNNPTGAVATREQLKNLVEFAKNNRSILIFDSAYASYIQDQSLPKSIFEIEGAREVAIEIGSFSKLAGFTGIRLGWSVVPEELIYDEGTSVKADWKRLTSTLFNGASNIAQKGGIAVFDERSFKEINTLNKFYLENARIIKEALEGLGGETFGGENAPYLWVRFKGRNSWDIFQEFLENIHLITTPGAGFGSEGKEFIRFTAFGHREHILEAASRLKRYKIGLK